MRPSDSSGANTADRVPTTTLTVAATDLLPLVVALAVREAAVLDRDALAEPLPERAGQRRRQADLGHEHQRRPPAPRTHRPPAAGRSRSCRCRSRREAARWRTAPLPRDREASHRPRPVRRSASCSRPSRLRRRPAARPCRTDRGPSLPGGQPPTRGRTGAAARRTTRRARAAGRRAGPLAAPARSAQRLALPGADEVEPASASEPGAVICRDANRLERLRLARPARRPPRPGRRPAAPSPRRGRARPGLDGPASRAPAGTRSSEAGSTPSAKQRQDRVAQRRSRRVAAPLRPLRLPPRSGARATRSRPRRTEASRPRWRRPDPQA